MSWQDQCIQRLRDSADKTGGWAYQLRCSPSAEPTALACLALSAHGDNQECVQKGLRWLANRQPSHGGVAINAIEAQPCWATALAYLAWSGSQDSGGTEFSLNANAAMKWLLQSEGKPLKSNPAIYGHDTRLKGWSWVEGTHSWVEPTAYAILALRAAGHEDHSRTRDGVSLLVDRAMSQGGWNYGNNRVFGTDLRPFPAQTGMVLAALAGEPKSGCIDKAVEFLHGELFRIRTPVSLGWGLIGVTAWHARPDGADSWLAECADRVNQKPPHPVFDSMLLLADAQPCLLLQKQRELTRGI